MIEIEGITFYEIPEIKEKLKCNEITVRKYLNIGKLKGKKIKNKWFISEENLLMFLKNNDN